MDEVLDAGAQAEIEGQEATVRAATFSISCAVIALLAAPATAAPKMPKPTPVVMPLSGEDIEILTHGPLMLFLQCRTRVEQRDVAGLTVVSSQPDMLSTGAKSILVPAGDDRALFFESVPAPDGAGSVAADDQATHLGTYLIDFNGTGGSAIEPDGWILTVPADSVGISIARYRFSAVPHSWQDAPDCLVTGVATLCKAPFAP